MPVLEVPEHASGVYCFRDEDIDVVRRIPGISHLGVNPLQLGLDAVAEAGCFSPGLDFDGVVHGSFTVGQLPIFFCIEDDGLEQGPGRLLLDKVGFMDFE